MIDFYNEQVENYQLLPTNINKSDVDKFIDLDPKKISWTDELKNELIKGVKYIFDNSNITYSLYRPFSKQYLYLSRIINKRLGQIPKLFPSPNIENVVISVTGVGAKKDFTCIIANVIPDLQLQFNGQCFPLYHYSETNEAAHDPAIFVGENGARYRRNDAINDAILNKYRARYGDETISKEDIFYYVYGVLHSPEYRARFANDLKKQLPRIPFASEFAAFMQAGRALAHLHLNYETIEPYPLAQHSPNLTFDPAHDCKVEKMSFRKIGKAEDKTTIIFNSKITLGGVPLKAYEYVVNGKSAIEWIMERYAVTTHKASGIVNNPNLWTLEHDDPAYILNLVKRVVRVSLETVNIVEGLPGLKLNLDK